VLPRCLISSTIERKVEETFITMLEVVLHNFSMVL
jgi:hypothetical protein